MNRHSLEYREGLDAYLHGESRCPYEPGTREHDEWGDGWTRARDDAQDEADVDDLAP